MLLPRLLGPVLWYDMIRTARRWQFLMARIWYGLVLAGAWFFLLTEFLSRFSNVWSEEVPPTLLAEQVWGFFVVYMVIQLLAIVVVAPVYTAGAITEEKDTGTLQYLFVTDLSSGDIVLGKLFSRLLNLGLFVLTGLPILSLIQLLGGLPPDLLWAGFIATALTAMSGSAWSMWCSVRCRSSTPSLWICYLGILLYFGLYAVVGLLYLTVWGVYSGWASAPPPELKVLETAFALMGAGNPFHGLYELTDAIARSATAGSYQAVLWKTLGKYALFHGIIFILFTTLAVIQVRRTYLRQIGAPSTTPRSRKTGSSSVRLFPLGRNPMLWKEVHFRGTAERNWLWPVFQWLVGILMAAILVLAFFAELLFSNARPIGVLTTGELLLFLAIGFMLLAVLFSVVRLLTRTKERFLLASAVLVVLLAASLGQIADSPFAWWNHSPPGFYGEPLANISLRFLGAILAGLSWLAAAYLAATGIAWEQRRQTWDSICASPLTDWEILLGKWAGSIAKTGPLSLLLLVLLACGVALGALHPVGLLSGLWIFCAGLVWFSAIGLFCSTFFRSGGVAALAAVLLALICQGIHLFFTVPLAFVLVDGREVLEIFGCLLVGESAVPAMFVALTSSLTYDPFEELFPYVVFIGPFTWLIGALLLYYWSLVEFRAKFRRSTVARPVKMVGTSR